MASRPPTPDFTRPPFSWAPEARFEAAPADGVLPEGFFCTSNLPTYVHLGARWILPARPRMDGVVVRRGSALETVEPRQVRAGEPVVVGLAEDGTEGVVVHAAGFLGAVASPNEFRFMATEVSRERPANYEEMAGRLEEERRAHGYLLWVVGSALVHSRARADFEWFLRHGYVQAVLIGNAVAVHDIEAAIYGTTLGMTNEGKAAAAGHERIPYVLAGSIRDDGPLPGVLTDTVVAQDAMRAYTTLATGAVLVATALHAIAVGNMLPAFHTHRGALEPLMTICVDQTEFVVSKLKDRGTHQAFGVVTNAQDFMHVLRSYVEKCRLS
jgi:hypothetical protein